jgi:hypothetical protein
MLALFLAIPATSHAEIDLMDGKLILSGFVKNTTYYRLNGYDREFKTGKTRDNNGNKTVDNLSNHKSHWDFSNFSALIEALYTIKNDQESTIRIFGGFKAWYMATPDYDSEVGDSMYGSDRRGYRAPEKFDDVVAELYLDYINGPWQVRTGKQIVIWGQLDMSRVADVVNPLDMRWGVPGIDTWEEVKQGLWMIRTFYQSQLPGNLLFEFILNPGYFASFKLPYEGTHWGAEHFKNNPFPEARNQGFFSWMQNKWFKDEPQTWDLDNYEIGGRVQGYTWDIDWTLLVWNALQDAPGNVNVTEAIKFNGDYFMGPQPKYSDYGTVYRYKRYTTIGGTAQTFTNFLNTVWRMEWFFEKDSPVVLGTDGNTQNLYDNDRADILGIAVQGNWNIDIPWFTQVIGTGKQASLSLTYFQEKVISNWDKDMCLADRNHRSGDKMGDSATVFFMQQMFNATWTFVFIGNYYPQLHKWMAVPSFTYIFADSGHFSGLRADLGAKFYGGAKRKYKEENGVPNAASKRDSLILRLRYEF